MKKPKTTNSITLPSPGKPQPEKKTLPYNGSEVTEKGLSFSFSCFDRTHELFNLGTNKRGEAVSGSWFLDLLDCLKEVNGKTREELRRSMFHLHPVDWDHANTNPPSEQHEYWQFRINKSKGRVVGFIIEPVFYVVWLDPHHNLSDSEGYGKAIKYWPPESEYERQEREIVELRAELVRCKQELDDFLKA